MRVQDDGDGITSEEAKEGFSHLGRSWKRYAGRSKTLKHVDYGLATTRCALRTQSHDVPDPPNHKWTAGLATEDLCWITFIKRRHAIAQVGGLFASSASRRREKK
jgi:hypothetical protein